MNKGVERLWQRWCDTVRFLLWGLTVALVCFLLYRVIVNNNTPHLVPMSEGARDSLMTVAVPSGVSDTLVRYGEAFAVHFNSTRGIANCAAYELTRGELHGDAERSGEFMQDTGVMGCPTPADYAGSGMDRGHLVPAEYRFLRRLCSEDKLILSDNCKPLLKVPTSGQVSIYIGSTPSTYMVISAKRVL